MGYTRMGLEERRLAYRWRNEGAGVRGIADRLGRAPSTISRELKRNAGKRGYRPRQADWKARDRARRPGVRRFTAEVKADVEMKLRMGHTPEMISGRATLERRPHVCKETMYGYIYADARQGGTLWKLLPRSRRKRRRRCPRKDGRGRGMIPNRRMISERPAEVGMRKEPGHWEGDLINGAHGTGNLVTMVERVTRYTLVGRTGSKEAEEVSMEIVTRFGTILPELRLSLTIDNGKEFARHEEFAKGAGMDVFFANPYHSWERGTNENVNGLIRRLYPKKSSFADIGEEELRFIDWFLNDRPRKCLGWRTSREAMCALRVSAP
jgi:IS30 family transposase